MSNANDSPNNPTNEPTVISGRRPSAARRRAAAAAAAPADAPPAARTTVMTVDSSKAREDNPPPTASQLDSIRNLLTGDESAGRDGENRDGDGAPPADEDRRGSVPKDLNSLAKQLGVKVEDLYGLKIRFPGSGEDRTLGDLKDFAKRQDDFKVRELRFEEDRSRKEADFMRAERDVRELFALLPPSAKNVREAISKRNDALMTVEKRRTLEVLPDWTDEKVRTDEQGVIREFLADHGFAKEYLDHVGDHRLMKLFREAAFLQKRVREVLKKVEEDHPSSQPGSKPRSNGGAPRQESQRRTGSGHRNFVRGQVAEIGDLIRGR